MIQIIWTTIPISPSCIEILPTYNLNGKSDIYLNGKIFEIFCKNSGKNGIGITNPDRISVTTMNIFTIPFSSKVNKHIMWYKSIKNTIKKDDRTSVTKKIKNLSGVIDKSNLKAFGKQDANKRTGKHLNVRLENLSPRIFDVHIE